MVLSTRCAAKRKERFATIVRTVGARLHHVYDFRMIRVHKNAAEIPAAKDSRIFCSLLPGCAAVVRTVEALVHNCENTAARRAGNDCEADPPASSCRQPFGSNLFPAGTLISGKIDARVSSLIALAGLTRRRIQSCVENSRVFRRSFDVRHSRRAIRIGESFRPRFATVDCFKETARLGWNGTSKRASDNDVWILRIHHDGTDEM